MIVAVSVALVPNMASAETASSIDTKVIGALATLYGKNPDAKALSAKAKAVLVFPDVIKAGLIVGGQHGNGAMRVKGRTVGYYSTIAASYGLQAGIQKFGYAMFFMTDKAVNYVNKSDGWEVGTGPSIVVMDKGAAGSMTTTSLKKDIYVFFFDQKGLMLGLGLQGTKISKYKPN